MDFRKRGFWLFIVFFIILSISIPTIFASFSDILNKITGRATSQTTSVSISIGNSAPIVDFISAIPAQSVTESSSTSIVFSFTASDSDGVSNLNDTSVQARFQRVGETTRSNSSCSWVSDLDTDTANYTCTIKVWYWDGAGAWTINATLKDVNNANAENSSSTFTLQETTAMVMSPTALTWASLGLTDKNQTSNNDPILVNNTANKDITDGNVKVTAISLQGETTTTQYIYAANFTVGINTGGSPPAECAGTAMVNGTATGVSGATITAGNNTASQGQEELYFCLKEIPPSISAQTYSTTGGGAWTAGIS